MPNNYNTMVSSEFTLIITNLLSTLFIIAPLSLLPFAHVKYHMQKLESSDSMPGNFEVGEDALSVQIYLLKCLGGICGFPKAQIEAKMAEVRAAGNISPVVPESLEAENIIFEFFDSLHDGLSALFVFGDGDNLKDNNQVRVFVYAGEMVIVFLLFAGLSAFVALLLFTVSVEKATMLAKTVVPFLLLSATMLYPAATWTQMRSSGSSLGSGYIVMAILTATMFRGPKRVVKYLLRSKQQKDPIMLTAQSVSEASRII